MLFWEESAFVLSLKLLKSKGIKGIRGEKMKRKWI